MCKAGGSAINKTNSVKGLWERAPGLRVGGDSKNEKGKGVKTHEVNQAEKATFTMNERGKTEKIKGGRQNLWG